jgi:hypothetical protein
LGVTINIPGSGQNANVLVPTQAICAKGTASRLGTNPNAIWAQLYGSQPNPVPASPPTTAMQGGLTGGTQWQFLDIPGASSSNAAPFPQNWLVVWAEYDAISGPTYDSALASFNGVSSTKTDCSP